ncbi:hypothetical protein [Streptomyces sp. WAC06614]|uniref:hypothetical protein n=1 Tax=Streptomyces sp. WAC06614 TaxID=2487416 RepID=UPI000F7B4ACF|nr:hypothetical protein [Streptomyces sp. WAC06614]RSS60975.1 hypothetical protein EF918_32275 [Streptomyces sp. WAC06614]
MPVSKNWEESLKVLMNDTGTLADRNAVAGPGSARWIVDKSFRAQAAVPEGHDWSKTFDIYWTGYVQLTDQNTGAAMTQPLWYVVGFNVDWANVFDNTSSKYNLWFKDTERNLTPLVASPYKNEVTNAWSFDRAADQLSGVLKWLDEWQPIVNGWSESVGSSSDDWRGSAAGSFKKFLNVINVEMSKVRLDLAAPTDYVALLRTTKEQLQRSTMGLYKAFTTWRPAWHANAVNQLADVFAEVMKNAEIRLSWETYVQGDYASYNVRFDGIFDSSGSNVGNAHWVDGIEEVAKQRWIKGLAELDQAAGTHIPPLDTAYLKLAGALNEGVYQPSITLPGGGGPNTGPGGGNTDNPLKDLLDKKGSGGGTGGSKDIPHLNQGGKNGPGIKPPVNLPGGLKPGTGTGTGPGSGLGPGSGQGAPLLDKDGKPVLGPDGKPVMVPPGSRIGKDGRVFDPQGNPVRGADGKPVVAPPGGKVGQPQGNQDPGGIPRPGANPYDQLRLPEGAKILENGTVVDAEGKQLLDSNGNPYALPKGATVKDGIVVDADGKQISRTHQLLTNAEHAITSRPVPKPHTQSDGLHLPDFRTGRGSGGSGLTGLDGLSSGGGTPVKGTTETRGGMTALGERATAAGASVDGSPAARAANATGLEQRTALEGQPPLQSPMMPPMSPGMGAGAGAPNQNKDRTRTTWLTEDEETWGTGSGSVSGVIGR